MAFKVQMSEDAEYDIEDIYTYIAGHDGLFKADKVIAGLEKTCGSLSKFPGRGNVPKELHALGITDYREVHFKPYRIVYRTFGARVVIYCVFDGRQDMQSLLLRRLTR